MHTFRKLLPYLRPLRGRLVFALLATTAFTGLSLLPPLLMRYLVDEVVRPQAWERLVPAVLAILMVPLMSAAIRFISVFQIMLAGRRFIAGMRLSLYRKVLNLSLRYHGENTSGAIVGRIMDDVNMLQRLLTGETVRLLVDVIVFVFSLSVAFAISGKLAGILGGVLFLYIWVYHFFSRRIRKATQSYRNLYDQISGRLQETIAGVRQVRIYNREEWETSVFLDRTAQSLEKVLVSNLNAISLSSLSTGIAGFGSTLILGLGAYLVLQGEITFGDLLAINVYVWMAINPAVHLTNVAAQLTETLVSVERILGMMEEEVEIQSPPGAPRLRRGRGAVEFREVHFGYNPDVPLYAGLSLRVAPGSTVALVGPTGCGKTSLTSLLMRYWDVEQGAILIDGVDIREVELKSLRDVFGVVLQEPLLFAGTLAENIAYGCPGASRERIEQAARAAEVYDLARALPEGFDTVIGAQGLKLSVGEKQRVSIARAILKDPLIMVMDEATSALDSESEALIQKALERALAGRTSFVIAHRLSTITKADMIVVMDQGRIIETGRHRELLTITGGLYRQLYEELLGRRAVPDPADDEKGLADDVC